MAKLVRMALAGMLLMAGGGASGATITVYTNVNFPPLFVDAEHGLYPELVDYLNRKRVDGFDFKLVFLPRKRMQAMLDAGQLEGIIIGMMPTWFGDVAQEKYLWTAPFFFDKFVLASSSARPLNQASAGVGLRVGVTLGYVYPGIDEWIEQRGLQRSDAPSEEKNLDKLVLGRVDAVVVTESVLRYYVKAHPVAASLAIAPLPGQQTARCFLVPHNQKGVFERLAPLVRALKDDPAWLAISARYQ